MKRHFILPLLAGIAIITGTGSLNRAADDPIPIQIESAVDQGLEWLARTQQKDGRWSNGSGGTLIAAPTALAVMAFMARGHTPGQGPYGANILRGIDYILDIQKGNGLLAGGGGGGQGAMYDHGICTVMLCEAYGMLDEQRQQLARGVISRAVGLILTAQAVHKNNPADRGGWRYTPSSNDSDTSVTGWQLMALRAAGNIGANIPRSALEDGINYIKQRCTASGAFMYTANSHSNTALTGTGILALILLNQADSKEVKRGADYLRRASLLEGSSHYYYTVYYVAQAAWQLGGRDWDAISPALQKDLLGRRSADGSWPTMGGESQGGAPYATAMSILALTVQYRYLPIYQR